MCKLASELHALLKRNALLKEGEPYFEDSTIQMDFKLKLAELDRLISKQSQK